MRDDSDVEGWRNAREQARRASLEPARRLPSTLAALEAAPERWRAHTVVLLTPTGHRYASSAPPVLPGLPPEGSHLERHLETCSRRESSPAPLVVFYTPRRMSTESSPRPPEFKTRADGRGGLVRVTLVGGPHDGHELYIDELDLPAEIWTTPTGLRFEWWGPDVRAEMAATSMGSDPTAPPVHHALRIPEDSREPLFVADEQP